MKIWEMMQHSGKKFKRKSDGFVIEIAPDGTLYWDSGHRFLNINDEWEEVKEPVTFEDVLRETRKCNETKITLKNDDKRISIENTQLNIMLYSLSTHYSASYIAEILLTSEFYIED